MKTKSKLVSTLHKNGASNQKTVAHAEEVILMRDILKKSENLLSIINTFPNKIIQSSGGSLGAKQQAFIRETFVIAQEDPTLLAHNVTVEDLDELLSAVNELLKIRETIKSILEKTNAQLHRFSREEQKQASSIYASIKAKAQADIPKMRELYNYLTNTYFKKKKSDKLAPRYSLQGYKDENGDLIGNKEVKHKGRRVRKNSTPKVVIPQKDLK